MNRLWKKAFPSADALVFWVAAAGVLITTFVGGP